MDNFKELLVERTKVFSDEVDGLKFSFDGYVYNPLNYGWANHKAYLEKYVNQNVRALFLGMNPGPFGMAQTAVPFGEVGFVKNWLKLTNNIGKPSKEHPKRVILGLDVERSEVSGLRLWGFFSEHYPDANDFFALYGVMNYCPLVFVDGGATGKNIIPEKLIKEEQLSLENVCDAYLDDIITLIKPKALVGIGRYAQKKLSEAKKRLNIDLDVFSILHPSPSNPQANKNWQEVVSTQLKKASLW
ncbi:MAG: uracil-DNA glycosylase family protein [Sphaerochaetaceae bacterium]